MKAHKDRCSCQACALLRRVAILARLSKTVADEQADDLSGIVGLAEGIAAGRVKSTRECRQLMAWSVQQFDIATACLEVSAD